MIQEEIKEKIIAWAFDSLGLKEAPRGWLRGDCPVCYKNNTFGLNPERNQVNCFVCGVSGSPINLYITLHPDIDSYSKALLSLKQKSTGTIIRRRNLRQEARVSQEVTIRLPEDYHNILTGDSQAAKSARSVLRSRGYNLEELSLQGVGYGTGKNLGFLILPYIEEGKLVYYTMRSHIGPKVFKNPEIDTIGLGKSDLIYNRDALYMYTEINIMESITNCLTLPPNSVAIGGKVASPIQIDLLIKAPVETYNIILDPDAREQSLKLSLRLARHKKVRHVFWQGDDDVNSLGKIATKFHIRRTPIKSYNQLLLERFNEV